jgi:ESX-1-secreted protein regulator
VSEQAAAREPADRPLRTLADKVNWLIDRARPAGRGPLSNAEVAALMEKVTGETFSHTTIWKLRNGQGANPQMRLIEALAKTFGVPAAFFFDDYDPRQAGLLAEQVELLALVRDAGVTSAQLRALLQLTPQARQAIADLVTHTARAEAGRLRHEQGKPP